MWWWKKNAVLKQQVQDLQNELGKEQGQASRLTGFLARLNALSPAPNASFPARALGEAVTDALHGLLQAEQALFLILEPLSQEYTPLSARGFSPQTLSSLRLRQPEDVKAHLSAPRLVQPLSAQGRPLGLLAIARGAAFSGSDKSVFELIASQVSLLYHLDQLGRDGAAMRQQTVEALTRALGAKDTYTHLHAKRTRMLTRAVAQELRLPPVLVELMEEGALLHDIGKIGIEDAILKKAGPLTPEETARMRAHARGGKEIIDPLQALGTVGAIVLYHQEWYNGTGYPEGLAGEEIPLGARVVQILDAWDAMTSDRPYRKALPKAQAMAELRRQAGSQFDPKLVEVFLRVADRLEREGISTTEAAPAQALAPKPA